MRPGSVKYLMPLAVLSGAAVLIAHAGRIPYPGSSGLGDYLRYVAMAQHPFSNEVAARLAPFCWRILVPLTVYVLPLPTLTGFWVTTLFGLGLAACAVMWLLDGLGMSSTTVVAGGVAFALFGPITFVGLWDYLIVDAVACALLTLAIAAAVRRRGMLLVAFLALGALTKETIVFAALFAVIWAIEHRDRRMLGFACAGSVAAAAILVGLRAAIHPAQEYSLPLFVADNVNMLERNPQLAAALAIGCFWGAWGLLAPFITAQFVPQAGSRHYRAITYTLLASASQLLIAADERNIGMVFPVAIAAAALTIEELASRTNLSVTLLWAPIIAVNAWLGIPFAMGGDPPVAPNGPAQWVASLLIAGVSVLVFVWLAVRQARQGWSRLIWGGRVRLAGDGAESRTVGSDHPRSDAGPVSGEK